MSIERFGDYQLLKKLATGGMAEIWLARQQGPEGFEKLLVVKRILPHLAENSEFVRMFLDEARIAARLNHPNIVQIFNLGAQDDTYFIAMEYIHGEDVRRAWKRAEGVNKPIPVPLVCRVIMDASAGLDYAHKKTDQAGKPLGIVHRDISPQNILVTFEGGVKVVDFGIAKAADQATVTRSGVLKGKYSYMSPEQASGMKVDSRSDIFALGVVLYELLTLTRLFKRSNDIQTLNAVTECDVVPPSKVKPDRVPASLDPVVMKALAKNAADRWQTAGELQAALENWLLQNQLPSSSVHLAAFLQDIYADRLAREAQEGQILIEALDQSRELDAVSKDKISRSGAVSRPRSLDVDLEEATKSVTQAGDDDDELPERATPGGQYNDEEAPTRRERSGSQSKKQLQAALEKEKKPSQSGSHSKKVVVQELERRPTQSYQQTQTQRAAPSRGLLFVAAIAAAVIGVLAVLYFKGTQRAEVHLNSEPVGAAVRVDGRLLSGLSTPCQLPPMRPGVYRLKLLHPGYQDFETEFTVPLSGEVTLGPFKLEPNQVATAPDGGAAASPFVSVSLKAEPPEAELWVDGQAKGRGSASFQEPLGATLKIEAKREGYAPYAETVTLHESIDRLIRLEKLAVKDAGAALVKETREPPEHKIVREPPRHEKQYGTVRFVVKPWANVTCGSYKLGQTPFGDTPLPVGTYDCVLTTDDYPSKTVSVTVKPNETVRVAVNF